MLPKTAYTIAKDAFEEFKQKTLVSDSPETKFNDRVTKKKLDLFRHWQDITHCLQQKISYPQG